MHELAVAQGLLEETARVASQNGAMRVERIVVRVGALSGVEPELLQRAFLVARAGSCAGQADLEIEAGAIEVRCRQCGEVGPAAVNRLVCGDCGAWQVDVVAGEELLLVRLELTDFAADAGLEEIRSA